MRRLDPGIESSDPLRQSTNSPEEFADEREQRRGRGGRDCGPPLLHAGRRWVGAGAAVAGSSESPIGRRSREKRELRFFCFHFISNDIPFLSF